jgi:SRSO17 transposase
MTPEARETEHTEDELRAMRTLCEALAEVGERMAPHFRRAEVRNRACRVLEGLLAPIERKNGWQIAEELGEHGPRGIQRLLGEADWDEQAVRDELGTYVIAHLGEDPGILVIDATGFIKKGKKSAGVARQYSGTAGRRENSQIGVFLLSASAQGAAFLDRELYLPEEWTQDRVRCREVGIADEVDFATKGKLAQQMLALPFTAGVPARWVVGDTVYGSDEMRSWLEEQERSYVLAVPETHPVWIAGQAQSVGLVAALLPPEVWAVRSAGEGSQGPRLYEWAWLALSREHEAHEEARGAWLLIRRSLSDPSKRASYRVSGPTTTTLKDAVQVAGRRWSIEEGLEEAKGEVGLVLQ